MRLRLSRITVAEFGASATAREVAISNQPCDFTGSTLGNTATFLFTVGLEPPSPFRNLYRKLEPGKLYFFNVRQRLFDGRPSCGTEATRKSYTTTSWDPNRTFGSGFMPRPDQLVGSSYGGALLFKYGSQSQVNPAWYGGFKADEYKDYLALVKGRPAGAGLPSGKPDNAPFTR